MKNVVAALTVGLVVGAAGMFLFMGGASRVAAYCPEEPYGNGDVNADGMLTISDAVYLLHYLFQQGPEPVPITCWQGLPATGQMECYDRDGNVIDCSSVDYPGQDGYYQAGCPAWRFGDNGDGTVIDYCTSLMWQKDTAPGGYTCENALKYCENLELAGYTDWRLPNVRELQSIVDYGRHNPAIDPVFGAVSEWYWSSSSIADTPSLAWGVKFSVGRVYGDVKDGIFYVRAVRGRP